MHKSLSHLVLITAAVTAAASALAAETRSAGKHEHGAAVLDIAIDGTDMAIDLDGPADNLIGFEHKPSTPEQAAALAAALATLRDGDALFLTPPAPTAGWSRRRVTTSLRRQRPRGSRGVLGIPVRQPGVAAWVEAKLFTRFPGTKHAHDQRRDAGGPEGRRAHAGHAAGAAAAGGSADDRRRPAGRHASAGERGQPLLAIAASTWRPVSGCSSAARAAAARAPCSA